MANNYSPDRLLMLNGPRWTINNHGQMIIPRLPQWALVEYYYILFKLFKHSLKRSRLTMLRPASILKPALLSFYSAYSTRPS